MEQPVRVESEPLAERGVVAAGVLGALGGGAGAVVLGAALGTAYPEACGTAGAMLGSLIAALAWLAAAKLVGAVSAAFTSRQSATQAGAHSVRPVAPHA